MMCKLQYSPEAVRDLDEIETYIAEELSNPEAASRIISCILDAADRLESFPELGALLSSITSVQSDYRFIPVESYLVFYRVLTQEVYVDRILYGRRDYMRILFSLPSSE